MPYDPMNQVHPGPLEGIDRIPAAPGANTPEAPVTVALDPDPRGVSVGVWQGSRCIYSGAHPLPAAPGSPAAVAPGDTQDEDERAIFEATFGLPAGIKWGGTRYVVDPEYDNSYLANTFVGQWEAWKVRARLAALAAGHVLQQFTISASDRFELTGAVGLLRGFGCVGPAAALQRALEAESIRFNASGVDAAEAAQERLHTFLNEAAGAGFELGGVAAGNCTSTCSRSGTPQGFPPSSTKGTSDGDVPRCISVCPGGVQRAERRRIL